MKLKVIRPARQQAGNGDVIGDIWLEDFPTFRIETIEVPFVPPFPDGSPVSGDTNLLDHEFNPGDVPVNSITFSVRYIIPCPAGAAEPQLITTATDEELSQLPNYHPRLSRGLPRLPAGRRGRPPFNPEMEKKNLAELNDIMKTFNLNPTDVAGLTRRSVKTVHDWLNPRRPADIPDDTLELLSVYLCAFVASDYRDIPEDKLELMFKMQIEVDLL